MDEFIIRKAGFSDLDQVCEIESESINSWTYNQFAEELDRAFSKFIVAEMSGIVAGYAVAWLVADELQLNSIAVKSSFRRKGVGRLLLEGLTATGGSDCISSILIEVRKKNSDAVNFYAAQGFHETGIRKKYYGDDDAILMEKKIP